MLSILIPCFDYNAYPLVCEVEKQALILDLKFEIVCIDDGSFSLKNELNQKINSIPNAKFIESKKNSLFVFEAIFHYFRNQNQLKKMFMSLPDTIPTKSQQSNEYSGRN